MTCKNKELQALLPAHLEQSLDRESQAGVERHVAVCEDCGTELALLRMMSEGPVPDPGEAFWSAMPGRIFREVRERKQRERSPGLLDVLSGSSVPRWAWAAAAVFIVASAVVLLDRPVPLDVARNALPENGTALEDMMTNEPVNVTEFTSVELDAATLWTQNAFAPIREAFVEDAAGNTERDLSEYLSELSAEELDRVYEMLKKKEQDARERLHRKTGDEKGLVKEQYPEMG